MDGWIVQDIVAQALLNHLVMGYGKGLRGTDVRADTFVRSCQQAKT